MRENVRTRKTPNNEEQQAEGSDRGDKGEGDGKDGGQETE